MASVLAAAIVAYDGFLKHTPVGPLAMGLCRFLNVLLGMSAAPASAACDLLGFGAGELLAAAESAYISWASLGLRGRRRRCSRRLAAGGGDGRDGRRAWPYWERARHIAACECEPQIFWLLLALLMFTVLRRCGGRGIDPVPEKVQAAVKHSILSLIWLDAATAVAVAGPAYGVAIAALLIPALLLGRWVYST